MKIRFVSLIALLFLQVFIACTKDSLPDGRFIGTWVSEDNADTIIFINDNSFKSPRYDRVMHIFGYSYDNDSITIQYQGPNKILVQPSTHHYSLSNSLLTIDFSKVNYGFERKRFSFKK